MRVLLNVNSDEIAPALQSAGHQIIDEPGEPVAVIRRVHPDLFVTDDRGILTAARYSYPLIKVVALVLGPRSRPVVRKYVARISKASSPADVVAAVERLVGGEPSPKPVVEVKVEPVDPFSTLVGKHQSLVAAIDRARRVARTRATVLLTGETGTGKELMAQSIHKASGRPGPFIPVNCGDLPDELLQSELWGYVSGAFTGAHRDKPGLVDAANGGTLFLDEIGSMPKSQQSSLLRFLEDGMVRAVGATEPHAVDVRVIAASNCPLNDESTFRGDLLHRVASITIELPPLRRRRDDIPAIARYLAGKLATLHGVDQPRVSPTLLRDWTWDNDWAGNVRELRNAVERWLLLGRKA